MNNVIRLGDSGAQLVPDDDWVLALDSTESTVGPRILGVEGWLAAQPQAVLNGLSVSTDAVCLQPDDDAESLEAYLPVLPMIAVHFPNFRDGRGYSQAYLLRTRLAWQGELRAVGDVLRDQLSHMRQCGFNTFALHADKSAADALKGLEGMSVSYAPSTIEPRPLFRRRSEGV